LAPNTRKSSNASRPTYGARPRCCLRLNFLSDSSQSRQYTKAGIFCFRLFVCLLPVSPVGLSYPTEDQYLGRYLHPPVEHGIDLPLIWSRFSRRLSNDPAGRMPSVVVWPVRYTKYMSALFGWHSSLIHLPLRFEVPKYARLKARSMLSEMSANWPSFRRQSGHQIGNSIKPVSNQDLIRGKHYGERSCEPHSEHVAAPGTLQS
jgi:hypothetical protein